MLSFTFMRPVFTPVYFNVSDVKCVLITLTSLNSHENVTWMWSYKFTVEHVHGYLTIDMGKQKFQTESEGSRFSVWKGFRTYEGDS